MTTILRALLFISCLVSALFAADGLKEEKECDRPKAGRGWSISKITLDRVRTCQNFWFFCISTISRNDYRAFRESHSKQQQELLFVSQVNAPKQVQTENVVIGFAGQQLHNDFISIGGQISGITGQTNNYGNLFKNDAASVPYNVHAGSLVNKVVQTGLFPKNNTFVALVFDAQFGYAYRNFRKNKIETGYFDYIVSKLGENVGSIYLAGHSRGGCLAMRLSARLAKRFPKARIVMHNFDAVCAPKEFGRTADTFIKNPLRRGYGVYTTDMNIQYPSRGCVAVRSFLSGKLIYVEPIRSFGHVGFKSVRNSLRTPSGFEWYMQSFHPEAHTEITLRHHTAAVSHAHKAFKELPCRCGS